MSDDLETPDRQSYHFISCQDRLILSRKDYKDIRDVERDHALLVSWIGPLSEAELRETVHDSYYRPHENPVTQEHLCQFLASENEALVIPWLD